MLSPLSLHLAAQDIARDRLQQAAHAALAAQLRASRSDGRSALARLLAVILAPLRALAPVRVTAWRAAQRHGLASGPRQRLAKGLRVLACRLDPAIASCDPPPAVLKVR